MTTSIDTVNSLFILNTLGRYDLKYDFLCSISINKYINKTRYLVMIIHWVYFKIGIVSRYYSIVGATTYLYQTWYN